MRQLSLEGEQLKPIWQRPAGRSPRWVPTPPPLCYVGYNPPNTSGASRPTRWCMDLVRTAIPPGPLWQGASVLVVDDEVPIRGIVRGTLQIQGFHVEEAEDGRVRALLSSRSARNRSILSCLQRATPFPCVRRRRTQHSASEAADNARHAAEANASHLAPDRDSGLRTSRARPRASPRPALAQRTSVRGRT